MLYQRVLMPEPGWRGSEGHCMTLVMRYLLVSRVERETNNDFKSSLLGSDRPSGLYSLVKPSG